MPKNVLVADDSLTMRKVVSLVLSTDDFRLIEVDNGVDAVTRTQEVTPDMVLVDGAMPGKDGFEVCAALKKNPKTARIPVLLLLNGQEAIDEEKVRSSGADAYIAKPFESQALLDKVCSMLGLPLVAALPMRVPLAASKPQPVASAAHAAPVVPPVPAVSAAPMVVPPVPVVSAAPMVPPAPAVSAAPMVPPAPVVSPVASTFVPPPSSSPSAPPPAAAQPLPAFLKPPPPSRAAAPSAAFSASPVSPSPASVASAPAPTREPIPRVAPVIPGGVTRRVPGVPLFGAPAAPPPSMGPVPGIAPSDPILQATTFTVDSPSQPGFPAPVFPPARAAAPPAAYAARPPPPPYASPSALRPLPLTQQVSPRAGVPLAAPMPRAVPLQRTPSPAASPSLFPPSGRPAAAASSYPSPGYRPPLSARAPMPHPAAGGGGVVRRDPFGLMGRTTPIPQAPPAVQAEAALRELLPSISKELLEKVIWEVVPQLAEALIREHIERLIQAKERGERR